MAANPNPTRISAPLWRLWQEFRKYEPQAKLGGIYADKPGYHNCRANLPRSDYSVGDVANDRDGPAQYASAIDLTLNDADMIQYSTRLDAAMKRRDPRLFIEGQPVVREFIGTLNGSVVYCYVLTGGIPLGVGADSGVDWGRDASHLWHIHLSFIRKFCNSWRAMSGVLSILKNEALENWEFSEMALSNEDLEKIATAVWAKQYGTDSTERRFGVKNQRARDYNMLGAIYGYDAVRNVNALAQIVAGMAQRVALDPAGMKALQAVLAVPPAEDNAEAVVGAFGGVDTETLAQTLRNVLGAEQAAELGAALSEDDADLIK